MHCYKLKFVSCQILMLKLLTPSVMVFRDWAFEK